MTLLRAASGIYEVDYRFKGHRRLHLSLGIRWRARDGKALTKKEAKENDDLAQAQHDAVEKLFRQNRRDMIEQLTLPKGHAQRLTPARLAQMVEHHEPLVPIAAPADHVDEAPAESHWGTVREVANAYLEWIRTHPRKAAGSYETIRAQIRRFLAHVHEERVVGDMPFEQVPRAVIEGYQAAMLDAKAKPNTITAYMRRVGALWNWAARQELDDAQEERRAPVPLYSPVRADKLHHETTARDRYLTAEEGERVLAATPEPLLAIVCLGLFAGLRLEEALFLRPRDVDLALGIITIEKKQLPDGELWKPKTVRSTRIVPIGPSLRPVLERHLAGPYASAEWLTGRPHDPAWPWHPRVFQNHFTAVVERAGLIAGREDPNGVTFHTLRHTFASHLAMQGVDIYQIAKLLGDTMQVAEETYAKLSPDVKRAAVAKLAGVFRVPDAVPETDTGRSV